MTAANRYTTAELVSNVQVIAHLPLGNNTFTAPQIINLANRELQTSVMKQILVVREGYYRTYLDYDHNSDNEYDVPADAIAGALDSIAIVQGQTRIPVSMVDPAEQVSTSQPSTSSYSYYIENNTIKILPLDFEGVLRVAYMRRPSTLVQTSAAARITAINGAVVTVSSLPTTLIAGESVDAVMDQPNFERLGTRTISSVSGTDITLDSAVDGLAIGDWIALEDQTPVPQVPVEFRPVVEQRVAVKIYELQGYLDKMKAAQAKLTEIEQDLLALISPRTKSQTKVVCATNGGVLSGGRRMRVYPVR